MWEIEVILIILRFDQRFEDLHIYGFGEGSFENQNSKN